MSLISFNGDAFYVSFDTANIPGIGATWPFPPHVTCNSHRFGDLSRQKQVFEFLGRPTHKSTFCHVTPSTCNTVTRTPNCNSYYTKQMGTLGPRRNSSATLQDKIYKKAKFFRYSLIIVYSLFICPLRLIPIIRRICNTEQFVSVKLHFA